MWSRGHIQQIYNGIAGVPVKQRSTTFRTRARNLSVYREGQITNPRLERFYGAFSHQRSTFSRNLNFYHITVTKPLCENKRTLAKRSTILMSRKGWLLKLGKISFQDLRTLYRIARSIPSSKK